MGSHLIYKDGGRDVDIVVASGDSIAIATRHIATVYQVTGYTNQPTKEAKINEVRDGQLVLGPYADGATLRIHARAGNVYYQTGLGPEVTELKALRFQQTPLTLNATGTLTSSMIINGIVTSTTASAVTATLVTGAILDTYSEFAVGDALDWSAINLGDTNAFTVASATGNTLVGEGAVAAETSATFRTKKSDADTFYTYRIA